MLHWILGIGRVHRTEYIGSRHDSQTLLRAKLEPPLLRPAWYGTSKSKYQFLSMDAVIITMNGLTQLEHA